jgi:hypothetical protein
VHLRTDMRSNLARVRVAVLALLLLAPATGIESAPARAEQPGQQEIARALEIVKADPNLAPLRTIRILRWRGSSTPRQPGTFAWLAWIAGLFGWFDQSARLLVWTVIVMLVGCVVVYIFRILGDRGGRTAGEKSFVAPSRVHDLDIRPESLPDDIGLAARRLWDRSERRAALALLYRGMLSRFAHVHQIPIRDSSTERDCLALAAAYLSAARADYVSRLVREWQRVVYGSEDIQTPTVYGLCDGFAPALDYAAPVSRIESEKGS